MNDTLDAARRALDGICGEPLDAAVLAHKDPERGGLRRLFGRSSGPRTRHNNWLVLTPTSLRLYGLGGRTGLRVTRELGCWPRARVTVEVDQVDRSSYLASTGSSLEYRVHRLALTTPAGDLALDVRVAGPLFGDDLALLDTEPDGLAPGQIEELAELRRQRDETARCVAAIVAGCGPAASRT